MEALHQLLISAENFVSVYDGLDSVSGDFFHGLRFFQAKTTFHGGGVNTYRNGMGRKLFAGCAIGQQFFFFKIASQGDFLHDKISFRDGSCFVHHDSFNLTHGFQRNSAFKQNSLFGARADSREECQWNT